MDVQTSLLGLSTMFGRKVSQSLTNSEIPLPGGRDAANVLSASARAFVDNAECVAGVIKVIGRLELFLMCQSLSGDTFGFTAQSTFTQTVEMEGVTPGMTAEVTAQVLECSVQPDTLRLKMTAVLELTVFVTAPVTTPFVTDITGAAGLEKRCSKMEIKRRVLLGELNHRIREEVDAKGVSRVLLYHGTAQITGVSYSGASSCEADGRLMVTVLTENEADDLHSMQINLAFNCSFDAPYLSSIWATCAVESISVVATDVSFGLVDTEAVLKIRLYGVETSEYSVLLDAYDAAASFTCRSVQLDRLCCTGAVQQTFSIQENVMIPKHLPDALMPIYACAMPVVTGVYERSGMLGTDVMLLLSMVYRCDEGKLHSFAEDIPIQLDFSVPFTPDAQIQICVLSVTPGGTGRTLTLSVLLSGLAVLYRTEPTQLAEELTNGGIPCPYNGILIYCADAGETLWDIGKRFSVPLSTLRVWNADLCDPLREGQAIVLMK
ncbi:MAG: DUF3794 domain-containing protein [Clostridia bacterium]